MKWEKSKALDQEIYNTLDQTFGFASLKPGQLEIMQDVLCGRKVVSVMPTGAGKSLCYQLPAVILSKAGGFCLVVSPLIALIKDQVDGLRSLGVKTAALTSAASPDEQTQILRGIREGEFDLVYVAPERFRSQRFMAAMRDVGDKLALLAIDEAHCISEWGHEFRPAYRMLSKVVQELRPPRILAVTATATPEVQADISEQLTISDATMHVRGFARPEICFSVEHCGGAKDKSSRITSRVSKLAEGSALVYAATRKNAERYAQELSTSGTRARAYHAGLEDEHRSRIQDEFMAGDIVIVATNAFGMGVDKTDVRLVMHADLPRSLEAYYQEAGRAGRDGKDADCILLFNHGDVRLQEFLINASYPSAALLRAIWKAVYERSGISSNQLSTLPLPGDPHESTLSTAVRILGRHGYLSDDGGHLKAVQPASIGGEFPEFDPKAPEKRAEVERAKLQRMVEYSYHAGCRHAFVLDYFGEEREVSATCEGCDNCQGFGEAESLSETQLEQAEALLALVGELGGRFGRKRIAAVANGSDDDERFYGLSKRGALRGESQKAVLDLLRSLEASALVQQSRGDYPTIKLSRAGEDIVKQRAELDPQVLRLIPSKSGKRARTKSQLSTAPSDPKMADKLRDLRSELAKERSVPAYVVFSNKTLEELASRQPQSLDELGDIHGIGPARIDSYGEDIIAAITSV